MPRSLVTGGAGFLGSHLVDRLIDNGHDVLVIDNLSTGSLNNIALALHSGKVTFAFGDCAQSAETIAALVRYSGFPRLTHIFHLASPASPEAYGEHPWETLLANSVGTMSLIKLALEDDATFIYSSTAEIYGNPLVHPQPESYFGNVDPIAPRSCYSQGKRFGEAAVAAGVRAHGLDARIVRFFNCYGPRMQRDDGRLIPAFVDAALTNKPLPIQGSGKQTRSMTYVDDAIDLLLQVATTTQLQLQPINVGNDDERSVEEIAQAFAKICGLTLGAEYNPARPDDPQHRRPDLSLARSLGWVPKTDLETGLARTFAWFVQERLSLA